MKNTLLIIIILFSFNSLYSQLTNANEGKRFLVTFPQNEYKNNGLNNRLFTLGIYISSQKDADVRIENHHNGRVITRAVRANDFIQIENDELGNRTDVEELSDGVTSNKVIEITSDEDISVSVINSKLTSSDGYLAYPVNEWGKNYIHNSLYHSIYSRVSRSSGFSIIASENNTSIKIILKGVNPNLGETKSGNYKIGDTISIELNSGQSYSVKTKSVHNGFFDLSGSFISSDKPIGIISFHERTKIPSNDNNGGMDNLLEMQQPLSNWRNKFISVDFGRKYGDFFRVLPIMDNTLLTITNYDEDGELVSQKFETINTGGRFYEYNNSRIVDVNTNKESGIKGNTIWEANNPILVSQYSYSYSWEITDDENGLKPFDPFMINLINENQFTDYINFLAPDYGDFESHKVNLIVKIDSTKPKDEQLKTIIFDNQYLYQLYPEIINNRIGNTSYYWLRFDVNSGVHNLESEVRMAAFIYGFGTADSYGMQTAIGDLKLVDTLVSEERSTDCDIIDIEYTIKSTFGLDDENLESISFDIADYELISSNNFDYSFELDSVSQSLYLYGSIINPTLPGSILLWIKSETGKVFYDTLEIENYNSIALSKNPKLNSSPKEYITIPIDIDESRDTLTFLEDFNLSFSFKNEWFRIDDILVDGDSRLNDTLINSFEGLTQVELKTPISREYLTDGEKVYIRLYTLLSNDTILTPTIILRSRHEEVCYSGLSSLEIESVVCAHNLRQVEFFDSDYVDIQSSELVALERSNISIFDFLGKEVVQNLEMSKSEKIDLDNYLNRIGLYFIRINNSDSKAPIKYFHK